MAHDLGLNLDPSTWSLATSDSNRRIRIWWALYIHDKWSALGLGRPSYLSDEHCNVPLPTVNNFSHTSLNNEPLGLMPALQFIAMASLTTILSDLLNTFCTLKAVERIKLLPADVLLSLLHGFQERLRVWNDENLRQFYNVNTLLDSSGSVILAYHTVEIVLLRAVLRCLPMAHMGYGRLREQAKTTLLNVVDFLEKLNVSRLRAFWWSREFPRLQISRKLKAQANSGIAMTRTNFALAGTFMFYQLLTSITTPDIEFWSATISHYRSLLRLQSHAFDMTKLACIRLDLLAAGMGVDALDLGGVGDESIGMGDEGKRMMLTPGSAEEWIVRQGHEGMLLC